jgi:hypothetical protein
VCLDGERISVRIVLFGLIVENNVRSDILENVRRVFIFIIPI